ncbi:MAG: hypothetical protein KDI49_08370 [Gammaproteobacteria bacterium]|nr:hypothetical protein [Gammaproteobacteria bacterium]
MDEFSNENHDTAVLMFNSVKCGLDQLEAIDKYIDSRCKIERAYKQPEPHLQKILDYGDHLILVTEDGREFRAEKTEQALQEEKLSRLESERALNGLDARSAMRVAIAESGLPDEAKNRLRNKLNPCEGLSEDDIDSEIERERQKLQPSITEHPADNKVETLRNKLDDLIRESKEEGLLDLESIVPLTAKSGDQAVLLQGEE